MHLAIILCKKHGMGMNSLFFLLLHGPPIAARNIVSSLLCSWVGVLNQTQHNNAQLGLGCSSVSSSPPAQSYLPPQSLTDQEPRLFDAAILAEPACSQPIFRHDCNPRCCAQAGLAWERAWVVMDACRSLPLEGKGTNRAPFERTGTREVQFLLIRACILFID